MKFSRLAARFKVRIDLRSIGTGVMGVGFGAAIESAGFALAASPNSPRDKRQTLRPLV